jgi:hypothetical protein
VSFYVNSLTFAFIPVSVEGYPAMATPLWHAYPFVRDWDETGHSLFNVYVPPAQYAHANVTAMANGFLPNASTLS